MLNFKEAKEIDINIVLNYYGLKIDFNGLYKCFVHDDKTGSLGVYNNKIKCFACDAMPKGWDNIDIVKHFEKLNDYNAAKFILDNFSNAPKAINISKEPVKQEKTNNFAESKFDLKYILSKCERAEKNFFISKYFKDRNLLNSVDKLKDFDIEVLHNYYNNIHYIIYNFKKYDFAIQKSLYTESGEKIKRNLGHVKIIPMIQDKTKKEFYICEGIEDSLSMMKLEKNCNVLCLNSINNINKFIETLRAHKKFAAENKFIIALDADEPGLKTSEKLKDFFTGSNIKFDYYKKFYEVAKTKKEIKDINDFILIKKI